MTKMVDLKNPPPKKDDKKTDVCCNGPGSSDVYSYGTRLELSDDLAKKFDILEDVDVGDQLKIEAVAIVTSVTENQRQEVGSKKPKTDFRVSIQLTKMSIEEDSTGEMKRGFDEESEE